MGKRILLVIGKTETAVDDIKRELATDYVVRVDVGAFFVSVDKRFQGIDLAAAEELDNLLTIKDAALDCGTVETLPARDVYENGDKVVGVVLPAEMRYVSPIITGIWDWSKKHGVRVFADQDAR